MKSIASLQSRALPSNQAGQALVEMALVLGVLLLILLGVLEFSYLWMVSSTLVDSASQGAQMAANLSGLPAEATQTVTLDGVVYTDVTQTALVRAKLYNDYYEALLLNHPDDMTEQLNQLDIDAIFDTLPPLNRVLRPAMRTERWTYGGHTYRFLRMPGALFRNELAGTSLSDSTPGVFRVLSAELDRSGATPELRLQRVVQVLCATDTVRVIVRFPYAFLSLSKYDRNWMEEGAKKLHEIQVSTIWTATTAIDLQMYVGLENLSTSDFYWTRYASSDPDVRWEQGVWTIGGGDRGRQSYLVPGQDQDDDTARQSRLRSGPGGAFTIQPARSLLTGDTIFPRQVY